MTARKGALSRFWPLHIVPCEAIYPSIIAWDVQGYDKFGAFSSPMNHSSESLKAGSKSGTGEIINPERQKYNQTKQLDFTVAPRIQNKTR